jgi:hypothetical protein
MLVPGPCVSDQLDDIFQLSLILVMVMTNEQYRLHCSVSSNWIMSSGWAGPLQLKGIQLNTQIF